MKRIAFLLVFCVGWLVSCDKDRDKKEEPSNNGPFERMNGSIVFNHRPDVKITKKNEFPESGPKEPGFSTGRKRTGMTATAEDESDPELRANDYRFKLVAEMSTLTIDDVETQATHVVITDDNHAFVSFNDRGNARKGGVIVYKYTIKDGPLKDVEVDVEAISLIRLARAEISAIEYHDGKLYMTGASTDSNLGYIGSVHRGNPAFFMVVELKSDKTFNEDVDPVFIEQLTSFQGTSIRVVNNRIYVTTGDGTEGTKGGLYIYNANDYSLIKFIDGKDNARSVDADGSNVFLMQAEPARVTKYDLDGNNGTVIYANKDESWQHHAKSELLAWEDYLFVAVNESGLRMLYKNGEINAALDRPGEDEERHVTNSVCMNTDPKKNDEGKLIQSNLLLLANGEKGIYWYDVMKGKGDDDTDYIVSNGSNSALGGTSANFIASKGNIVFVADGLGGLKVLYVGFNPGDVPPDPDPACDDFMNYLYRGVASLLPEGRSVFRTNPAPDPIIQKLFSNADDVIHYIEVLNNNTELFISFLFEDCSWRNALGFFVIPASANVTTDEEEYAYYQNNIRPNLCTTVGRVNVLKEEYIIYRNIRSTTNRGTLEPGSTSQIGGKNRKFNAGDKVVLFMAPDSWNSQNDRVEINFTAGAYDQIFFTNQHFNLFTRVTYSNTFRQDFRGIQHNAFTAEECNSIVMFFEDNHNSSDTDYNDVIVSITDNTKGNLNTNIKLPRYTIKVGANGRPEIIN